MANGKRYYWLKMHDDFFLRGEIKKLCKLSGGYRTIVLYLKLLLLTIKTEGVFIWTGLEPTLIAELALRLDVAVKPMETSLACLIDCGLVEKIDENTLYLADAVKFVGAESASAERSREYRKKLRASQCNTNEAASELLRHGEIEIEIESEIELESELEKELKKEREIKKEIKLRKEKEKQEEAAKQLEQEAIRRRELIEKIGTVKELYNKRQNTEAEEDEEIYSPLPF